MIKVDLVCPLFHADKFIDNLIADIQKQEDVILEKFVFAIT